MKTNITISYRIVQLALLMTVCDLYAQYDPEKLLSSTVQAEQTTLSSNPLLLDNRPLNYALFSIASKGTLALQSGNAGTSEARRIPFRIYLNRQGLPISQGASDYGRTVQEIEVATVLAMAKPGDILIIEPIRSEDRLARRTIQLTDNLFNSRYNLFSFLKRTKEGC